MFAKIICIVLKDSILYFFHFPVIVRIYPSLHCFRHSSDNIIIFQEFFHWYCIYLRHFSLKCKPAAPTDIIFPTICHDKFFKAHRVHFHTVNFPYRERNSFFSECDTKQRTCCNDMEFWHIFTEIFQRLYCPWAVLYLIKNNQCLSRNNFLPINYISKFIHDPFHIEIIIKNAFQSGISIKIEVCHFLKFCSSELFDKICLSTLANACH